MRRTKPTSVARRELIGLRVSVGDIEGLIVDETKHTFLVETPSGEKRVPKAGRVFRFRVEGEAVAIDGKTLMFRPEDRTKKVRS